jgi:hypothetical protein
MNKYANTVIYKIVCNDLSVKDTYVGRTTHFTNRKKQHKHSCNTLTSKDYNYKVYEKIRAQGGWSRWNMTVIEEYPCDNSKQAAVRERYYHDILQANLNTCIPNQSQQESSKQYKDTHKATIKESSKLYRKEYEANNRGKINARANQYYELNKEKINAQARARYILKKKQNIDITV